MDSKVIMPYTYQLSCGDEDFKNIERIANRHGQGHSSNNYRLEIEGRGGQRLIKDRIRITSVAKNKRSWTYYQKEALRFHKGKARASIRTRGCKGIWKKMLSSKIVIELHKSSVNTDHFVLELTVNFPVSRVIYFCGVEAIAEFVLHRPDGMKPYRGMSVSMETQHEEALYDSDSKKETSAEFVHLAPPRMIPIEDRCPSEAKPVETEMQDGKRVPVPGITKHIMDITGPIFQEKQQCFACAAASAYINTANRIYGVYIPGNMRGTKIPTPLEAKKIALKGDGSVEGALKALEDHCRLGIQWQTKKGLRWAPASHEVFSESFIINFQTTPSGWEALKKGDLTKKPEGEPDGDRHAVLIESIHFGKDCVRIKNSWKKGEARSYLRFDAVHDPYFIRVYFEESEIDSRIKDSYYEARKLVRATVAVEHEALQGFSGTRKLMNTTAALFETDWIAFELKNPLGENGEFTHVGVDTERYMKFLTSKAVVFSPMFESMEDEKLGSRSSRIFAPKRNDIDEFDPQRINVFKKTKLGDQSWFREGHGTALPSRNSYVTSGLPPSEHSDAKTGFAKKRMDSRKETISPSAEAEMRQTDISCGLEHSVPLACWGALLLRVVRVFLAGVAQ